ncbi:MAG: hypothetical protein QOI31_1351 [Solirubrobacterales bacterium]|jgi:hypothetical protein|nr:hypothetical protein [Solirubrobacterales bacterium]
MKYRNLPGTGISVSNLALGTMGFGTETDEPDAFAILDRRPGNHRPLLRTACCHFLANPICGWSARRPHHFATEVRLAGHAAGGAQVGPGDR